MAELSIKNSREEILENLDVEKVQYIYRYISRVNIFNNDDLSYLFKVLDKCNYVWRNGASLLNSDEYEVTESQMVSCKGIRIEIEDNRIGRNSVYEDDLSLDDFIQILILINNKKTNTTSFFDNYGLYTSSPNSKFQQRYNMFKSKYLKNNYEMLFVNTKSDIDFNINNICKINRGNSIVVLNYKNLDKGKLSDFNEIKKDDIVIGYIFKFNYNIFINCIVEDVNLDKLFEFLEQTTSLNLDIARSIFNRFITNYNKTIDMGNIEKSNKISDLQNKLERAKNNIKSEMKKRHENLLSFNKEVEQINKDISFEMSKVYTPTLIQHKLIKHIEVEDGRELTLYTDHLFISQYNRAKLAKMIEEHCNDEDMDDDDEEWIERRSFDKYLKNLDDILNSENVFYLGYFKIYVNIKTLNVRFINLNNQRRGYWGSDCNHPHVENDGDACLGNLSEMISDVIINNDLNSLMIILVDFLQSANVEDDAGNYISNWDLVNKNTLINVLTKEPLELEDVVIKE